MRERPVKRGRGKREREKGDRLPEEAGWRTMVGGIDARKTERISRANGRDEHEINGNVRRNMELEAGEREREGSRWAKSIEGGNPGRRGTNGGKGETKKRMQSVEHTRMESGVYGCARTHM